MLRTSKSFFNLFRFSIHNYNKTFPPEAITRIHNRILVDQFYDFKEKPLGKIQQFEKENYDKHLEKWDNLAQGYWNTSIQRTDTRIESPPQIYDDYQYFTKVHWNKDRQYNIIYRKKIGEDTQTVVLDVMKTPQLKKYAKTLDLVKTALNPSHTLLCFGCDLHNNEYLKFYIKNLQNNTVHQQKFQGSVKNVQFNDDSSIFYLVQANDKRAYQLYFKKIGSDHGQLIYQQKDPEYHLDFHKSKDGKHLILVGSNRTCNQIHVLDLNKENKFQIKTLLSKQANSRGFLNKSNKFYLWTDKDSYDFKITVFDEQLKQFVDFYSPEDGLTITQVDLFQHHIVLYLRKHSKSILRVIDLNTKETHDIDLKEQICMITPGLNEGFKSSRFNFFVSTPLIYNEAYEYDIPQKKLTQLNKCELTGPKFDKTQFKSSVVLAPSQTGDYIPISIIQKKNRKGPAKLLLKVYGFYGMENQVQFGSVLLTALENDWVIAYAHVRGGNQLGNKWWKSAILENKSRAWKDLKQCVGYLFAHQYTHPSLLVLQGSSAGAITVWNAINNNPYLYKAAVLSFPFLDVLNSLLDQSLPLTSVDHSEFGNPIVTKKYFNTIQSYCPYQTIKTQQYPAIYIQTGKNDYRCPLYQVLKFVKRFRQRAKKPTKVDQIGQKGVLVEIHDQASHTGSVDAKSQTLSQCRMFGYLDFLLLEANKDLTYK